MFNVSAMKSRFFTYLFMLTLLFCAACASSCKKNDSEATKKYLNGSLKHEGFPAYVLAGHSFTYKVAGVWHPLVRFTEEGHHLGYYYTIPGLMLKADTVYQANAVNHLSMIDMHDPVTVDVFEYTDTLGTFSLSGVVFPEDADLYYSSSLTSTVTTVDPDKSIPQIAFDITASHFWDERDGIPYNYIQTDTTGNGYSYPWMQQNLAYAGEAGELGRPYVDLEDVNYLFGRYYTWEEAQSACPKDWRLPTEQDWVALANVVNPGGKYGEYEDFVGFAGHLKIDARFNGVKMWEFWPEAPVWSNSMMHVIPTGYCANVSGNDFKGLGEYAFFWCADTNPTDPGKALYRYCHYRENDFKLGTTDKNTMAMPVRCVYDPEPIE